MDAWSGGGIHSFLLLLLLLPTLLLAQDDCSHNCKNEANRYYYVRPEGSKETLCPAQPCLTPSQLREHFSECERNNSCQTANTSLVLLPGTYTSASNHGSIIPQLKFLSLTGYNEDCDSDSLATPSIDCNGTWISLMFQHIKCLHVQYCAVFTGYGTTVEVDHVTFHDSLIRLASVSMDPGNMTVANNAQVVFQVNHAYRVGGAIYSRGSDFGDQLVHEAPCLVSFGANSTMDLLHNTAERGGSAMYGIRTCQMVSESRSDVDYKFLFDIITIITAQTSICCF